jgi:PAS domain S-box-containing protein
LIHPDDRNAALNLIRNVATDGQQRRSEFRVLAADGSTPWFRVEVFPADGERPVQRIRGLMTNITEQQEANRRFNTFLESAPDAIVVVDSDGRMVLVNHLTETMFGFRREELIGQPVEVLVPERYRKPHVAHRTGYAHQPKTRPMGMGRALTGAKKDGTEFPIEISLSPLASEQGALVISIIRDLTERLKTEAKFRGFLESAPDAVVIIDREGRVVLVNSLTEQMFGYKREELLGQLIEMLVPERFRGIHVRHREGYSHQPKTRPMGTGQDLLGRRKDGSEFPVEISLSPLETEQGTLVASIIRDITERKQAEQEIKQLNDELRQRAAQLEQANQELESFSYSVSHDLRAPLRAVDGYVRILQEDCGEGLDAEGRRLLNVVSSEARRMGKLIDDLLAFSRLGRQQMQLTTIDLTDLARTVFDHLVADAPGPTPRLELKPLPSAEGDPAMLRQVFVNLIGNAIKFSHHQPAPVVEVTTFHKDGEVVYCIRDNGVGFDEKYRHKLFNVFQRLHSEEEFEGTGVGLALVQRVIHRHGGRVWAESQPGQGATFYFTLPTQEEQVHER